MAMMGFMFLQMMEEEASLLGDEENHMVLNVLLATKQELKSIPKR